MTTLAVILAGYPILLAGWVALDRATGWTFADAYGKDVPR